MLIILRSKIKVLKNLACIAGTALMLALSFVIIFNAYYSPDHTSSQTEILLEHYLNEHNVNENHFGFIKISTGHKIYYSENTNTDSGAVAAISLFLLFPVTIFYDKHGTKLFYAESFPFNSGYKKSLFKS